MFKNISVRTLLIGVLGALCLMLAGIGATGLGHLGDSNAALQRVYLDRVVPLKQLKHISDEYAVHFVDAVNKANAGLISAEDARREIEGAQATIATQWKAYRATQFTEREAQLAAEVEQLFVSADAEVVRALQALGALQGDVRGQLDDVGGAVYASIDPISNKLTELVELQLEVAKAEFEAEAAEYPQNRNLVWALIAFALIASALLARILLTKLGRPLQQAMQVADSLAAGDLSARIEVESNDELGRMLHSMQAMQRAIVALVDDVRLTVDAAAQGDFQRRIDVSGHRGFAADIGTGLNRLSETTEAGLQDIARVSQRLAAGDLSEGIERSYPGVFGRTASAVNQTVASLRSVIAEIDDVVSAAANRGEFNHRVALQDKQGFSRRLGELLNHLAGVTQDGLDDTIRVAAALAEGDLTQRIERSYPGLFGRAGEALNATVQQLQEILRGITTATETMRTASTEIASGNTDLSERTEQQAASLEETASSMEELTSAVRHNADNSRQARGLAEAAAQTAARGGEVVGSVVETMREISASSRQIGEIISVIDGIAFQTNILALNAAVEAARAGEQGRGFAVVASEVRTLAQRSGEAAKEIRGLIANSTQTVERGAQLVDQAGSTMGDIVGSVRRVADLMGEITAASDEQSAGIEQVNVTIMQMDQNTQQNAALVEEAMAAARSMEDQAESLGRAVARFRLDSSEARPLRGEPVVTPAALRGERSARSATLASTRRPLQRSARSTVAPRPKVVNEGHWNEF